MYDTLLTLGGTIIQILFFLASNLLALVFGNNDNLFTGHTYNFYL